MNSGRGALKRKIECSFQSGEFPVDSRVLCSVLLTPHDIGPDAVSCNSDSPVLAEVFNQMIDGILHSAEAFFVIHLVVGCETFS